MASVSRGGGRREHGKADAESRFRRAFRRAHAGHPGCLADEWLTRPCSDDGGRAVDRPLAWSRRNGPWREVDLLFIGAAPGNAGGRGGGEMGAHATRIPFGGDVAGANLDVLLASIGITRNDTFIAAALNQLPDAGGGEPTSAELARPVGDFPSSLHLLRDTLLAARPRLLVALGNVAIRSTIAAARLEDRPAARRGTLPGLARLRAAGLERGVALDWPADFPPDAAFDDDWHSHAGRAALPRLLWLVHPSAQNMSPYARAATAFHTRMLDARDALRAAARQVLGFEPPAERPPVPAGAEAERLGGVYALPEWRDAIGPRHRQLAEIWREKGV